MMSIEVRGARAQLRLRRWTLPLVVVALTATASAQAGPTETSPQTIPSHTSVGSAQHGRIAGGGVELPVTGPGYHFQTQRQNPRAHFGTPALVGALRRAATRVAERFEGSDLAIEDLSFERGRRIRGHGSHTSGRDVDITYYAQRENGERINPTRSRWFLRSGRARGHRGEHLDVERTWMFLEALLNDEAIRVQYIFMHRAIQRRILAHATDPARDRFEELVRVPRGRNMDPHADHFHVRIFCPEADVAHGCLDGRR